MSECPINGKNHRFLFPSTIEHSGVSIGTCRCGATQEAFCIFEEIGKRGKIKDSWHEKHARKELSEVIR